MRLEQSEGTGKLSQAGGPESHGTCSYCLALSSSSHSYSLMGIPHNQLLQEANKGNQAPESLIHLHGLPLHLKSDSCCPPTQVTLKYSGKEKSSERAGFGVCTLSFASYVSKDRLSTNLYLYLFIYLTVLDLSCGMQEPIPQPGIEHSPPPPPTSFGLEA